jgi:PhzF family phenazine biosynthesis protein
MRIPLYQLDAFATRRFSGNPAAVMVFDAFPDAALLQALAAENNLSETAFLVRDGADYRLRWFTPKLEVPLCGHATLASAAVVMERLEPDRTHVVFATASGPLAVTRDGATYAMDFPARPATRIATPSALAAALGVEPVETVVNEFNYLARLPDAHAVRTLAPDLAAIARMDRPGVIVTARSDDPAFDFMSRYFAPAKGVPEDPVTGGAHCMLAPYWTPILGKAQFRAAQLSARGGEMRCRLLGDRVELRGECVFYLEGEAQV